MVSAINTQDSEYLAHSSSPAEEETQEKELTALGVNMADPPRAIGTRPNGNPTLLGVPMEVLDMVLAHDLTPVPNGTEPGVKFTFKDGVGRGGRPRRSSPIMPASGLVSRRLRYAVQRQMYKNATISLLHDDVKKTVAFLAALYPASRNGIKGLHIEYQREQPVDYEAFGRLCRIIRSMKSLDVLHLSIPINPALLYAVDPAPGLINRLIWHKDNFMRRVTHENKVLRGYAWKNSRRASWVQDLLTIDGNVEVGSLTEFRLTTSPRHQGSRLKGYLENYMCEEKEVRMARIRQLQAESHWSTWLTLPGLLTAIQEWRI